MGTSLQLDGSNAVNMAAAALTSIMGSSAFGDMQQVFHASSHNDSGFAVGDLLTKVNHVLDLSQFFLNTMTLFGPGSVIVRSLEVAGRLCTISSDLLPNSCTSPQEMIFQLFMLGVATTRFLQVSIPRLQVPQQDEIIQPIAHSDELSERWAEPAGVHKHDLHTLAQTGALKTTTISKGEICHSKLVKFIGCTTVRYNVAMNFQPLPSLMEPSDACRMFGELAKSTGRPFRMAPCMPLMNARSHSKSKPKETPPC